MFNIFIIIISHENKIYKNKLDIFKKNSTTRIDLYIYEKVFKVSLKIK